MYQQKFMPYNKMNDVYEQQQFQQEDSQPLIEEVDPHYQPTEKQVKQYAIEILGMSLPEDDRLLYLARQGLKAPIPTNWQPFQGRDGQVYYKHKITQQKTYEHPTDVQYRKKYVQEKQTVARKNLKSMNLKNNPLSGLSQPLGQGLGGLGPKIGINPLGLSNLSSQSHPNISKQISKLDPKIEQELQNQVQQLEKKLKKQLKQFQTQRRQLHEKNMKKYKNDFENSFNQLKSQKSSSASYEKFIKQQKQRIKQRIHDAYEDRFNQEFIDVQKQQEQKYNSFVQLYQEDNKIKLKKYEISQQEQYRQRCKKLQSQQKKHEQNKRQKQKQRQKKISQIKQSFQQEDNREIEQATKDTYLQEIHLIKQKNEKMIRGVQDKLNNQLNEMKKILGHDPNQILQQMAQKRNRLKKMSQQKLQSLKKKQYQKVIQSFNQQLQKSLRGIQAHLQSQNVKQLDQHKLSIQSKLQTLKVQLDKQKNDQVTKMVEQLYSQLKRQTNSYQKGKNKKILQIREKFISLIVQKNDLKTNQIDVRLKLKDKEEMIQSKQELNQSLKRQVQLQRMVLKDLKMNKSIVSSNNIDVQLKKLMVQLKITYKPEAFLKHQRIFNELKAKYKSDKQLLASMMSQLQNTSFIPFYDKQHSGYLNQGQNYQKTSTTSVLVKQYNKDVRVMRKNQQMLSKYQINLRKAELNDETAIRELESQQYKYEDISLRTNLAIAGFDNQPRIRQIQTSQENMDGRKTFYGTTSSYQSVEDSLKQHSKFLSNVKAELNRKLYKVRSNNFYRV